jgi:hypothetical protein
MDTYVHVTTHGDDDDDDGDDEFNISQVYVACIKPLDGRRGKYVLLMAHFSDDDIPPVSHRLNKAHHAKVLHDLSETPHPWRAFTQNEADIGSMYAYLARFREFMQSFEI